MKGGVGGFHLVVLETFFGIISPALVGVNYDFLHLLTAYSFTVSKHSGSDRSFGTDPFRMEPFQCLKGSESIFFSFSLVFLLDCLQANYKHGFDMP